MANVGDHYIKDLKPSHLGWGDYRRTGTRPIIYGEAYIPIPKQFAKAFSVFNSNHLSQGLGNNIFLASSKDGFLQNVELLAQGCSKAGDPYAKQFSAHGDLKRIGAWYQHRNAHVGTIVSVEWISPTEIMLDLL